MKKYVLLLVAVALIGFLVWNIFAFNSPEDETTQPIKTGEITAESDVEDLVWNELPTPPWHARDSHTFFEFNGRLWVLGGLFVEVKDGGLPDYENATYFDDIWSSADGVEWKLEKEHAAFPLVRSASVIERDGKLIMLGGWIPKRGYDMGIWTSEDAINWKQISTSTPFEAREGQKLMNFGDKLLLTMGVNYYKHKMFNDVWVSDDGIKWTELASSTPWAGRWDGDLAVYNGRLYVAGGMASGLIGFDDVWSSADGKTWIREVEHAPFGTRQGQMLVVFKNKLLLVGGLDAKTDKGVGDVWYTEDGRNWKKLPNDGAWAGKEDQGVLVWKDSVIMVGGMDSKRVWHNDVWVLK